MTDSPMLRAKSTVLAERGEDHPELRSRWLAFAIGSSLLARLVSLAAPLLMVPLTLHYLGDVDYAIWMTAASLSAMAAFADLGLGQGLVTRLTPLVVGREWDSARELVSTTYAVLASVALAGSGLVLAVTFWVDWPTVFNVSAGSSSRHLATIAAVCLLAFMINIPLALIVRVQYAFHAVTQANIWQALGGLVSLALAWSATVLDLGATALIAAATSGPLLTNAAVSLLAYNGRFREVAPAPRHVRPGRVRNVLSGGSGYLTLTIVMSMALQADNIIVSHAAGATAVVGFAVAARLFAQLGSVVSLLSTPLWPANAGAIARGEMAWVVRTTSRMTLVSLTVALGIGGTIVLTGADLFSWWTGDDLGISRWLLAGWAVWWSVVAVMSPRFMVQNSVGIIKPQLIGWGAFLLLSLPAKFAVAASIGPDWVPWVAVGAYAITVVPGCMCGYRLALHTRS